MPRGLSLVSELFNIIAKILGITEKSLNRNYLIISRKRTKSDW